MHGQVTWSVPFFLQIPHFPYTSPSKESGSQKHWQLSKILFMVQKQKHNNWANGEFIH